MRFGIKHRDRYESDSESSDEDDSSYYSSGSDNSSRSSNSGGGFFKWGKKTSVDDDDTSLRSKNGTGRFFNWTKKNSTDDAASAISMKSTLSAISTSVRSVVENLGDMIEGMVSSSSDDSDETTVSSDLENEGPSLVSKMKNKLMGPKSIHKKITQVPKPKHLTGPIDKPNKETGKTEIQHAKSEKEINNNFLFGFKTSKVENPEFQVDQSNSGFQILGDILSISTKSNNGVGASLTMSTTKDYKGAEVSQGDQQSNGFNRLGEILTKKPKSSSAKSRKLNSNMLPDNIPKVEQNHSIISSCGPNEAKSDVDSKVSNLFQEWTKGQTNNNSNNNTKNMKVMISGKKYNDIKSKFSRVDRPFPTKTEIIKRASPQCKTIEMSRTPSSSSKTIYKKKIAKPPSKKKSLPQCDGSFKVLSIKPDGRKNEKRNTKFICSSKFTKNKEHQYFNDDDDSLGTPQENKISFWDEVLSYMQEEKKVPKEITIEEVRPLKRFDFSRGLLGGKMRGQKHAYVSL